MLTHSGPNVPPGTTVAQSKQTLLPVFEEPEHEETVVPPLEPIDPLSVHTINDAPCLRGPSPPRLEPQTTIPDAEQEEASLALLRSLKNETSRRVQPARHRPVGASDATTEGVDSSIIEAAEKARTVKPIIPPGTKFVLYNGPVKEGEKEVKWELSAGQRAGNYGENNSEGGEEGIPVIDIWEVEEWDALAECEDDDVGGHAPVITNGVTLDSCVVSAVIACISV